MAQYGTFKSNHVEGAVIKILANPNRVKWPASANAGEGFQDAKWYNDFAFCMFLVGTIPQVWVYDVDVGGWQQYVLPDPNPESLWLPDPSSQPQSHPATPVAPLPYANRQYGAFLSATAGGPMVFTSDHHVLWGSNTLKEKWYNDY